METNTPSQIDTQSQLIAQLAKMYGAETAKRALPLIVALISSNTQQHAHAQTPPFVLGTDPITGVDVELSQKDLTHTLLLLGQSGMGKSEAMLHLARYHMEQGHSLIVAEPHGQLTSVSSAPFRSTEWMKSTSWTLWIVQHFPPAQRFRMR